MPEFVTPTGGSGLPPPPGPDEPVALINALVSQALDDIDEGRIGVEIALRTIALIAWSDGRRQLSRDTAIPPPTDP
jgi:hypothetical protein